MLAFGVRVATEDEAPLVDVVWIRDTTETARLISRAVQEVAQVRRYRDRLAASFDGLPVPVWLRDDSLALVFCNQAYADAVDAPSPEVAVAEGRETGARDGCPPGSGPSRSGARRRQGAD